MPRLALLSSSAVALALLLAPRLAGADVPTPAPSPMPCRGAIQHPIDVRVEALDAVRRGQMVRVRLTARSSRPLDRVQARLIHLGGATQAGPERVSMGRLQRDADAVAEFRVVVPRVGRRALLQFVVTGDEDGLRLGRGATLNLLPDGPQRPESIGKTSDGSAVRVYRARRIDR